jgi:hypothetical protein
MFAQVVRLVHSVALRHVGHVGRVTRAQKIFPGLETHLVEGPPKVDGESYKINLGWRYILVCTKELRS